jgi:hypothetical protein
MNGNPEYVQGWNQVANPTLRVTPYFEEHMAAKQSSSALSSLASKILSGEKKPTVGDARKLAASVLGQDETKGQTEK